MALGESCSVPQRKDFDMSEIKAGDTVQIKSGGPVMTVEQIGKKHLGGDVLYAWCVWFEGTKQQKGVFALTSLTLS
jgi:uncharacterized protein YodC (DUF2158 family)